MDLPHILVIAASAGSGKTRTLSERYINILLSPTIKTSARNILAITFTNKAAGEMRERIISGLKKIALSDSEENLLAEERLNELLERFSDLRIQTIDSFLASIIISSALELGLPPHFEIVLDPSGALNFVLDELLSGVYKGGPTRDAFCNLVRELLEIEETLGWDIKKTILDNITRLRNKEHHLGQRLKRAFYPEDLKEREEFLKKAVKEFLRMGEDGLRFNNRFLNAANSLIEKRIEPWESKYFLKESVEEISNKGSRIKSSHQEAWFQIRQAVASLTEITAHSRFAPFLDIIEIFDKGLMAFKAKGQLIFIEDLNQLLASFLSCKGIVPRIYFYLGDKIFHFLIDEFQDTSRLQWKNLFPLIEESLSKGGSLFYVGDKKQAIYGFRGGDSLLFDEAKESFPSVGQDRIKEEPIEINYRSQGVIVEFVNEVFSRENLTRWAESGLKDGDIDIGLLLKTYADSRQRPEREARAGLVRVEKILEDEICDRLISLIRDDLSTRFSLGNIAILLRTNTEASLITGILTGANIPVASEKTLDISSNYLIQEIVSFLKFLDSPIDNFAFASFISGEIFLKVSGLGRDSIFSFLLENRESRRPLYTLLRDRFPEVWQGHIEEYFHLVGFLPTYDLLSRIFKRYHLFENFPDEEGFFYQLLEVAKEIEKDGRGIKAFLELWQREEQDQSFQVVLPEYTDGVRVMTIHKAKGLGFPVVISPFTYLADKPIREVYDRSIPYRINKKLVGASLRLKELWRKQFTSQLIDELNTFYVALTRAEDELYIFIPEYRRMIQRLPVPISFEGSIFERGSRISRPLEPQRKRERHSHPPLINEWQDKLHRPLIDSEELVDTARKKARERGRLIHNFLAKVIRLSDRWDVELEGIFDSLNQREREIIPHLKEFFSREDLRRWFVLPDKISVFSEREIVDGDGKSYRVDRVLLTPEMLVVIDFKSGEGCNEEHKRQLATYMRLLSRIYPDRTIEGRLIYVDESSEVCVDGQDS